MKQAAIYIRVSTHGQEELSPAAQQKQLLGYAHQHGYTVLPEHIFLDSGISGRMSRNRPAFLRMIELAKTVPPPFSKIFVWKFSRFARNQEESILYKSLLRKNCQVELQSITEPISPDAFGQLMERIIEWMDEFYSAQLSDDVRRGMKENASKGSLQTRPPLGYALPAKGEPPVILKEEADIIRWIYKTYAAGGHSCYAIARQLNLLGKHTKNGHLFEAASIRYLLQNPMYKGYLRWNRTCHITGSIRPKEEWILTKGEFPSIVSEELWEKVQQRLTKDPSRSHSSYPHHWLFGLVRCSHCGKSMVCYRKNLPSGTRYYLQCNGYLHHLCPTSRHISETAFFTLLLKELSHVLSETELTHMEQFLFHPAIPSDAKRSFFADYLAPVFYDSTIPSLSFSFRAKKG